MTRTRRLIPTLLTAALLFTAAASPAAGAVKYLPGVTAEMSDPGYWLSGDAQADTLLCDLPTIRALNRSMLLTPDCTMNDLETLTFSAERQAALQANLANQVYKEAMDYVTEGGYYDRTGAPLSEKIAEDARSQVALADPSGFAAVRYGIAVHRTDLRSFPTEEIITDDPNDMDFDYVQLSRVNVNEPMIIRGVSADGLWYFGLADNCTGWVRTADVAICQNRREWLSAWKIPDNKVLVVTESRMTLEQSNSDPQSSLRTLTMGTVLELADPVPDTTRISNRSAYQNHMVWLPVRNADGSYGRSRALISEKHGVSEGYLPLTRRNLLNVAFQALGDAYGWGSMLSAEDCSSFVHAVYACFGFRLPRNTSWQSAAPVYKYDVSGMSVDQKKELLSALPAGAVLFFRGHEMLYLGERDGKQYVLSSVSSMMAPDGKNRLRVRSVVINTLDTLRANGQSWIEALHTLSLPYLAPGAARSLPGLPTVSGFVNTALGTRYLRENGSVAANCWENLDNAWYWFGPDGQPAEGWRKVNGKWYCFRASTDPLPFRMYENTVTPDGYQVDASGAWVEGE